MISKEQADELNRMATEKKSMREYRRIANGKSATSHVVEWWVSSSRIPGISAMSQFELESLLEKRVINAEDTLVKRFDSRFWEPIAQTPCIPDSMLENIDWQKYLTP